MGPVGRTVGSVEERRDVRRPDVVVARADDERALPGRQHLHGLVVLLGVPVVGDIARVDQHVRARVHAEQLVQDELVRYAASPSSWPKWVSVRCATTSATGEEVVTVPG